uniref:Inhibitor of growth protein n=1 Tax=Tetraodon nigroviridis TaxID=99883 RepID=H3C9W3_TETNG
SSNMLYLEDYLEMIEQLPMDLRDRFTEMREMDLQVQNATDQLEQKVNEFFVNAKKNKPEWREEQMEVIKKDYYKALEDADEKVQLANQIYDLVDRHLRKLDQELAKFKMELEADNAGITEILERPLGLLQPERAALWARGRSRRHHHGGGPGGPGHSPALAQELSQQASALRESEANSQVDWTYDPNEPRYCICNQVSYGEMVGCDNTDCPIEWFHYGCVGLTEAPKGKWYCPQCTAAMKRRG